MLLTACYNQLGSGDKAARLQQARKRAEHVLGGFCGFYGDCGAGVGTGIFISVMTGATPLSGNEWKLCNRMTAESLMEISEYGGPRCCKRDTFLAILTAGRFMKKNFNTTFGMDQQVACEFYPLNNECLHLECPFYPLSQSN